MIVWPGLRRSVSAISRLFNSAAFYAPLTHSAIPTRAASGTTATFTRATTATVRDNEGVLRTAIAGEARFEGARMVRNLFTFTEDIGNAAWTKRETTYSGGRLIETAATADHSVWEAASTTAGNYYVASGHAKADQNSVIQITFSSGQVSGDPKANFNLSTGALGTVDAGLTAEIEAAPDIGQGYYRVSVKAQAASTSLTAFFAMVPLPTSVRLANYAGNISNGLYLNKMQLEDVTAQTTQTAGEYVSVGVESAPYYHGSGVDGVKCFPTDLSGNPLTTMERYKSELAATNLCLQSNAFTTTWTAINTPAITQNAVGPDGATSAWTLIDNAAGAVSGIQQSIAITAAAYTFSIFVKKTSGATSFPVLLWYPPGPVEMQACTVDTNNGVATDWTAYTGFTMAAGRSVRCTSYNDDFWRVELTKTGTAAAHNIDINPAGTTNPTQSSGTYTGSVQGSAVFYGAQVELGSSASSYIATTTTAGTRNADILTYSGGDIPNLKTLMAGFRREVGVGSSGAIAQLDDGTANDFVITYLSSATAIRHQGTDGGAVQWNLPVVAVSTYVPGTACKSVQTWTTNDVKAAVNGATLTGDTAATVPTVTQLTVGHLLGAWQLDGNVGPIYGWTRNQSQSELNAVTQ